MQEKLHTILASVVDMVKFAEAKNAALFTVNVAGVIAVLQILTGEHAPKGLLWLYLVLAATGSTLSALICLLSFMPLTRIPILAKVESERTTDNLFFFGDIQKYSPKSYTEALSSRLPTSSKPSELDVMLAAQVVVNSRIASRKFAYFTAAMGLTISSILPVVGTLVLIFSRDNRETVLTRTWK